MPVSRKRKKSQKSAAAARASRRRDHARRVSLSNMVSGWTEAFTRRVEAARPHARALAESLRESPATGTALEDELCFRLGPLLTELADRTPADTAELLAAAESGHLDELLAKSDDYIGPEHFAEALADAVADTGADRVRAAVTAILPSPLRERTGLAAPGPALGGPVLWTPDRYGTRFAVVAPFAVPDAPVRWYLWDVDTCTVTPLPVHAGFYASPEEALAAWQVGVGPVAAGGTSWRAADDPELLEDVLPALFGLTALGGESAEQHAEYLRCRRLAETVVASLPRHPVPRDRADLPELAAEWMGRWPDAQDEAGAVLDAWPLDVPALALGCSPHRVAYVAQQIREEYGDEAGPILALLPGWVDLLATRNGLTPELVARARPYAEGLTHPDVAPGDRDAHQARVIE
ncbi:hypothetical protein FHR83_004141 [Actinoplanes campanulatus]|uniref:Uncharacterized protein n=1 Tax=Actinoplanes campanulatus TaxID=113559 RepID=A0A7W5AI33_9ACTN|nr:hypothetical protein [Actinoplanes campanulatus]MBB3096471.1 hypothetical protein [Actinoplanes campanulatus]